MHVYVYIVFTVSLLVHAIKDDTAGCTFHHRCSPMYMCVCPYSTVASSVVAVNVPSEEGSSERPDFSICQAPTTRGT